MRAAPLEWLGPQVRRARAPVAVERRRPFTLIDYRRSREVPTRQEEAEGELGQRRGGTREGASRRARSRRRTSSAPFTGDAEGVVPRSSSRTSTARSQLSRRWTTFCTERFVDPPSLRRRCAPRCRRCGRLAGSCWRASWSWSPDAEPVPGTDHRRSGGRALPLARRLAAAAGRGTGEPGRRAAGRARRPRSWVAAAARKLRQERPTDPASYLLLRGSAGASCAPAAARHRPAAAGAPADGGADAAQAACCWTRWPELLNAAEEVMAQPAGRGWLDLQRYALTAATAGQRVRGGGRRHPRRAAHAAGRPADLLPAQTLMDDSPPPTPRRAPGCATRSCCRTATEVEDAGGAAAARRCARRRVGHRAGTGARRRRRAAPWSC
jgi:hypothetical protein